MMENGRWEKLDHQKNISGLLIAAGLSERMNKFKPLMLSDGSSFVIQILKKMKLVCRNITVVTGFNNELLKTEIEKYFPNDTQIHYAFNPNYEKGMFTSLQCGLRNLSDSDWILYHFVDQPCLPELFYKDFINQIDNKYNWIQPRYNNRNGHPILLEKSICQTILNDSSEKNLKDISLQSFMSKKFWQCNYPQVLQDIDTPEDYKKEIQNEHL